jgi:hypothetical protein
LGGGRTHRGLFCLKGVRVGGEEGRRMGEKVVREESEEVRREDREGSGGRGSKCS